MHTYVNGLVLWQGKSRIDGKEIVAIVTGVSSPSHNSKTGPMAQTWIIRTDVHPYEAICSGADRSVCGDCQFRKNESGRLCYVTPMALGQIYKSYRAGNYSEYGRKYRSLLRYRYETYGLRIGSYGEPTAVPVEIWKEQLDLGKVKWTGYTQRWEINSEYQSFLMASVNSGDEAERAHELGWRTYRVKKASERTLVKEIVCPASYEAGRQTECSQCLLCNGGTCSKGSSITIDLH